MSSQGPPSPRTLPHTAASTAPWSPPQTGHPALCLCSPGQICCAGVKKKEQSETGIFPCEISWPRQNSCPTSYSVVKHSIWSVPKADSSQYAINSRALLKMRTEKCVHVFLKAYLSSNSFKENFRYT